MWRTVPVAVDPGLVFPLQSAKRRISHISLFKFHLSQRPLPLIVFETNRPALLVPVKNAFRNEVSGLGPVIFSFPKIP